MKGKTMKKRVLSAALSVMTALMLGCGAVSAAELQENIETQEMPQEWAASEQAAMAQAEAEQIAAGQAQAEAEQIAAAQAAQAQAEAEQIAAAQAAQAEAEQIAAAQAAQAQAEADQLAAAQAAQAQAEADQIAAAQAAQAQAEADQIAAAQAAQAQAEADQIAAAQAAQAQAEADQIAAAQAAQAQAEADQIAAAQAAQAQAEADQIAAEQAAVAQTGSGSMEIMQEQDAEMSFMEAMQPVQAEEVVLVEEIQQTQTEEVAIAPAFVRLNGLPFSIKAELSNTIAAGSFYETTLDLENVNARTIENLTLKIQSCDPRYVITSFETMEEAQQKIWETGIITEGEYRNNERTIWIDALYPGSQIHIEHLIIYVLEAPQVTEQSLEAYAFFEMTAEGTGYIGEDRWGIRLNMGSPAGWEEIPETAGYIDVPEPAADPDAAAMEIPEAAPTEQALEGEMPPEQVIPEQAPESEIPPEQIIPEQTPEGEMPQEQVIPEQTPEGEMPAELLPADQVWIDESLTEQDPLSQTPGAEDPAGQIPAGDALTGQDVSEQTQSGAPVTAEMTLWQDSSQTEASALTLVQAAPAELTTAAPDSMELSLVKTTPEDLAQVNAAAADLTDLSLEKVPMDEEEMITVEVIDGEDGEEEETENPEEYEDYCEDWGYYEDWVSYSGYSESQVISTATPFVLVKNYSHKRTISTADAFDIEIEFLNTSQKVAMDNVVVKVETSDALSLASGTNTIFISRIEAGGTSTQKLSLLTAAECKEPTQKLSLSVSFEYVENNERKKGESAESITLPIVSKDRLELKDPVYDEMQAGKEGVISVSYVNKGHTSLYNLEASLHLQNARAEQKNVYAGNIESGKNGTLDFFITPQSDGDYSGSITLTYENASQKEVSIEIPLEFNVMEAYAEEEYVFDETMFPEEEYEERSASMPLILGISGGAAALLAILLVVILKKRKAKLEANADLEDWFRDEGER